MPAERIRAGQARGSLRKLMPQLVGYLTSAAVHLKTNSPSDTCQALLLLIDGFGVQTGVSFRDRVDEKQQRS